MFEKKQPWNPFPLAALSAGDKFALSPCATQIIHYLAARSNHTGWTCVGQDRVAHDLRRSKDYVTSGFKELREKKVIVTNSRGRKVMQGDSCVITPELLPDEWRKCNPARQEDNDPFGENCNPVSPEYNPAEQEDISKCNPVLENVILPSRAKPYSNNLTENQDINLTDLKPISQKQVSKLVSENSSVAPLPRIRDRREVPKQKPTLDHDSQIWISAEDLFNSLMPDRLWTDADIELLIRLAGELRNADLRVRNGGDLIREAWTYNQIHKRSTPKLLFYCVEDLARGLRSTSPRSLLNQMRMHEGCKLCMDECAVCKTLIPADKDRRTEPGYCEAHKLNGDKQRKNKSDNIMDDSPVVLPLW